VGEQLTLTGVMTYLDTEHSGGVTQPCYFQQTEAEGCVTLSPGVQVQYLDGKPGPDAPKLKYNLGAIYDMPLAGSFDAHFSFNYVWQDDRHFELALDPIGNYQKPYDTLDLTAGIADKAGKYEVTLFGKNVLDEHYKAFAQSDAGRDGRARGFFSRGAFAYYGINLKYNFK
jgi:iron complex outermembrane receptor protein